MALINEPPVHESFDPNKSEQWRVWLRDVWARLNKKLEVAETLTEGGLITTNSDGDAVNSGIDVSDVLDEDELHTYTGERYLTENLVPEAGTEPGIVFSLEVESEFSVSGAMIGKITTVTDTYQILKTDQTVVCNKGTGFTVTMPLATVGQIFNVKNIGLGAVTLTAPGTDTFDEVDADLTITQYDSLTLQCRLANKWIII